MNNPVKLKAIIAAAPEAPGVYLMRDARGKVLYVGKAKSLRRRLSSYARGGLDAKTMALMSHVGGIELRPARTESLALLLEAGLIRQYTPKYNISLRDDKSFPMVKITHEDFPRVCVTRTKEKDGAAYFGPYTGAGLLREALRIIRRHFPYRSCAIMPDKACIYYRIGLSPAPCIGKIGRRAYRRTICAIAMILNGKSEKLVGLLTRRMNLCARRHKFEEAALLRDQITAISSLGSGSAGAGRHEPAGGRRGRIASGPAIELEELRKVLGLAKLPERIEAFDISNIGGQQAAGSMVSFRRGRPDKDNYRRFRIKTVAGIDDYRMLAEAVGRRYRRLRDEHLPFPDLVLIDGGRQHLAAALRVLEKLGAVIPVISIAKEFEHVYIPLRRDPIAFASDTPALNLIRRVRDEAHRFAVAYHHILRRKKVFGA